MTRRLFRTISSLCLLGAVLLSDAFAYEVQTHETLSGAAALQSNLAKYLPTIGLKSLDDPLTDIDTTRSVVDWIREGAHDEDDTLSANFARYRNHFFDPQHGGAGYSFGALAGEPSPDWALEDTRSFVTQSYSLKDARQAFYDALTVPSKDNRERWMARTFYILGHIIHHTEDMAQPQHTRNDSHGGFFLGPRSRYELYTDRPETRNQLPFSDSNYNQDNPVVFNTARRFWSTDDGKGIAQFSSLNFLSTGTNYDTSRYPLPRFSDATPWDDNANQLLQSVGATVPPDCLPPNQPCFITFFRAPVTDNYRPAASGINERASTLSIFDQDLKVYNKTVSSTDPDTGQVYTSRDVLSLNRFNFDAAHEFLIPRAVAYSAGLIDYFFRGRLEAQDAGYIDSGIALRVKNAIDVKAFPHLENETLKSGGKLIIGFEYNLNNQTITGASDPITLTEDLKPGRASMAYYRFDIPAIPAAAAEVEYRLVYRGKLGQEDDALAVGAFEPVSGFVVTPNANEAPRLVYHAWGTWRVSEKSYEAGNIDWKGWYGSNGRPTKVLSWAGAQARYFPDSETCELYRLPAGFARCRFLSASRTSRIVYQDGELFGRAPAPVLAAAVVRDTRGEDWLVAVVMEGTSDVVYRRPYRKSNSDEIYDPDYAPDGWQAIGEFRGSALDRPGERVMHSADIPWFFNGSGKEAQTLRRWWQITDDISQQLMRLKLSIDDDVTLARFQPIEQRAGFVKTDTCTQKNESSTKRTWETSGEYIVAVDYQDLNEVLGIVVREGAGEIDVDSVKVDREVVSTSLTNNYRFHEIFRWGGADLEVLRDIGSDAWTATTGPGSRESEADYHTLNISYYLDLRYDLHSFYEYDLYQKSSYSGSGATLPGTLDERFAEAHRIVSSVGAEQRPFENSYTRTVGSNTSVSLGESRCGFVQVSTVLFSTNFGWNWDELVGGWAVDTRNRFLVSQEIYSDGGYEKQAPYAFLTGTNLQTLLPGKTIYYPVGVVR